MTIRPIPSFLGEPEIFHPTTDKRAGKRSRRTLLALKDVLDALVDILRAALNGRL